MAKNQALLEIMDLVGQALDEASECGLEIEVIASTIQYLQEHPGAEASIALQHGLQEWDL